MKYAVIDCGSNSIRLLLCDYDPTTARFTEKRKFLRTTRLGKGVHETKMLSEESVEASLQAVQDFVVQARSYGASRILMLATSAVRDALNGIDFKKRVLSLSGIEMEILSGSEEAKVGYLGVRSDFHGEGVFLIVDIGGGSTELIVGRDEEILDMLSIDLGAVRLFDMVGVRPEDAVAETMTAMRERVRETLLPVYRILQSYSIDGGIGIGGTITTFGAMERELSKFEEEKVSGLRLSLSAIRARNAQLRSMEIQERRRIPGLEATRADIIVAGGILLEEIVSMFCPEGILISVSDNLEGYLLRRLSARPVGETRDAL